MKEPAKLYNLIMKDGSRHFGDLPEIASFDKMYEHATALPEIVVTGFVTDQVTEMWLDLEFRGNRFSINNQMGEYWFFVEDPECPDEILLELLELFRQ